MTVVIISLRLLHVLAGVYWVGSALFLALEVGPSLAATGAAGGTVLLELRRRRYHHGLLYAALVVIASGLGLLWIVSGGMRAAWLASPPGVALLTGAVASVAAVAIALTRIWPAGDRMAALIELIGLARRPPTAEEQATLGRYGAEMGRWSAASTGCLLVAAAAMGVARYL
ncbi:MAG: hypothetical protein IPJ95_05930 [Gemmatimonadetes bacterium]|jgi:hypothetical protein|nr:hypothetical protein [Gemmatimonadota bacterium]MBK7351646.1 hypothetical protein [Gemmatimonadota bacterium]MBK7923160.1 hypothetical protein [Gemmatimonadota bacterium]MBK9692889.1 hypothetical protein [Gemmatimonadota bacterium]MBP9201466.1 hypothetical protein [Gemmatimonadales bacterium]